MNIEAKGVRAADANPSVTLGSGQSGFTTKQQNSQRSAATPLPDPASAPNLNDWRDLLLERGYFDKVDLVAGEIGPVHLIGSPRVVVATRGLKSWVWITQDVWGRGDRSREWLKSRKPGTHHPGAVRYGRELAQALKVDADREAERVERKKVARAAELVSRNGGAK